MVCVPPIYSDDAVNLQDGEPTPQDGEYVSL